MSDMRLSMRPARPAAGWLSSDVRSQILSHGSARAGAGAHGGNFLQNPATVCLYLTAGKAGRTARTIALR